MKRFLVALAVFVSLAFFPAAAFSSELDGIASVAARGYLPAGLFAKATGYLPGDTVSILNPSSGVTVDVLNIGTLERRDDVILLISAEAAELLGLPSYASVPVKLSARNGSIDGIVSGKAILSGKIDIVAAVEDLHEASSDGTEPSASETEKASGTESPSAEKPAEDTDGKSDNVRAAESPAAEVPASSPEEHSEQPETSGPEPSEPFFEDVVEEPYLDLNDDFMADKKDVERPSPAELAERSDEELFSAEPLPPVSEGGTEEPSEPFEEPAEYVEPGLAEGEDDEPVPEEAFEADEIPEYVDGALSLPEKTVSDDDIPSPDEPVADISDWVPPAAEEDVTDEPSVEPADGFEPVESFDDEEPFEDELFKDEPFDDEPFDDELVPGSADDEPESPGEEGDAFENPLPPQDLEPAGETDAAEPVEPLELPSDDAPLAEAPEESEGTESKSPAFPEGYGPIVLIPADSLSPEESPAAGSDVLTLVPVETGKAPSTPSAPSSGAVPPSPSPASVADYTVGSEADLAAGSYYIQAATMGEEGNLLNFIAQFGKYPVALVPEASGAYRVLVGPLSMDEYGAVLEKLKAAGFKDAFVRHVPESRIRATPEK